jgi:outer membrane protein
MRRMLLCLLLTAPLSALAQSSIQPGSSDLPAAPVPSQAAPSSRQQPPIDFATNTISMTRSDAERLALRNNPRITASRLLALAAGQVTRETRAGELPQISGSTTAAKAEDGSRISAGSLTDSRLYTHAGAGGEFSQLITDFGHTHELIATNKLQQKAQNQTALATEQDVLLATDQAFYRLLNAQSLLDVARATVAARGDVQSLTSALTRSALKSDLDLNIASADLSQAQLLQLDAENAVASASAALAAVLAEPADTLYHAVEDSEATPPPPPSPENSAAINTSAQATRPDLQALRLNAAADQKFARAQQLQHHARRARRHIRSQLLRRRRREPDAARVHRPSHRRPGAGGPAAPEGR